jgi:outer membrane biosynthesis protein TonB
MSLQISGLDGHSADKLAAEVGRVLLTPEDYLQLHGVRFEHGAAPDPGEIADPLPTASSAAQRLAAAITVKARRLLAVDPVYRSPNRKVRYEGQVELVTVVGADGQLHQPRLVTSLGEHEARVLRVLPLWRYEPARRGNQPVAVRLFETAVLRID